MTQFIVFAIIGMVETSPNVCKIEYMRYIDVETVVVPCDLLKDTNENLLPLK